VANAAIFRMATWFRSRELKGGSMVAFVTLPARTVGSRGGEGKEGGSEPGQATPLTACGGSCSLYLA
jgi:hypothetical protein